MEERKVRVAITHGDTNGIGYEVILKAFEDPAMLELCTPIIYGSPKAATYHRNALQLQTQFSIISNASEAREGRLNIIAAFDDEVKIDLGTPTPESAEAAQKALKRAKEDLKEGLYDVLVQAPVIASNKPDAEDKSLLVLFSDEIRIALVTNRLPIKDVAQNITTEKIEQKARLFHKSLKRDFRINNPRIAVLALNPQPGTEEETVIRPAVEALEKDSIQAFGPYTADEFFGGEMPYSFDGILAMYDDQGNVPFKTLATEFGVKMKTGFPFVVTTPDQDPGFDQAGKGTADPASMRHAIYAAVDIFRNRINYDEPLANPLPKLYHEKREDGEKARFTVKPKDQFKREDKKSEGDADNAAPKDN
jgi:4-hydroxythreonine-4-phosphate dehydrogenase